MQDVVTFQGKRNANVKPPAPSGFKEQLLTIHNQLRKAIKDNDKLRYSVFGKFATNYERFYLAKNSSLASERKLINKAFKKAQHFDDAQTQQMKERIYAEAFAGSQILKRDIGCL